MDTFWPQQLSMAIVNIINEKELVLGMVGLEPSHPLSFTQTLLSPSSKSSAINFKYSCFFFKKK
jgi:hypothetical protein